MGYTANTAISHSTVNKHLHRDGSVISGYGQRALKCSWILTVFICCWWEKGITLWYFLSISFIFPKSTQTSPVSSKDIVLLVSQNDSSSESTLCSVHNKHFHFHYQTNPLTKANYLCFLKFCQEHKKWCARPAHRSCQLSALSPRVMDKGMYKKMQENRQAYNSYCLRILSKKFAAQGLPEFFQLHYILFMMRRQ